MGGPLVSGGNEGQTSQTRPLRGEGVTRRFAFKAYGVALSYTLLPLSLFEELFKREPS